MRNREHSPRSPLLRLVAGGALVTLIALLWCACWSTPVAIRAAPAAVAAAGGYAGYGVAIVRTGSVLGREEREVHIGRISGGTIERYLPVPVGDALGARLRVTWSPQAVLLTFPDTGNRIRIAAQTFVDSR